MTKFQPDQYGTETYPCNGRLTLGSGSPITSTDQSAKSTLYFTPYLGNYISLYDSSSIWNTIKFIETSLNISAYTASKPYDIWGYNNSGSLSLASTIWTDGTTRATALAYQDGVYVKSGSTTHRYLGSIYINSSGSNTSDTETKRFVWNYYNRIPRKLYIIDTTDNWNYTTATWRSANNSVANRVEIMSGVSELPMRLKVTCSTYNASACNRYVGIALDATNTNNSDIKAWTSTTNVGESSGIYNSVPSIGYHYFQWTENSDATGTTTWYGDLGDPTKATSGMIGYIPG